MDADRAPAPPGSPRDDKAASPRQGDIRPPRRISSGDLFGDAIELEIEHRGALYRLRQTALGKLILTK